MAAIPLAQAGGARNAGEGGVHGAILPLPVSGNCGYGGAGDECLVPPWLVAGSGCKNDLRRPANFPAVRMSVGVAMMIIVGVE